MTAPLAQPFYFGASGAGLFGWLHRPPAGSSSDFALVICNPFGFEEVCAHRSLSHLGHAAAAAGVATLRFDYAGCGNSEGDDFEPQRWAAWIRSVHQAADTAKQAAGVSRVCLLGVRLGATLATLAAMERDDVVGLIAIAPVVRGRAYLRELTILGESGAAAMLGASSAEGLLESGGFLLTRETSAALSAVDLRTLDKAPAPRVLIVERDDMPGAIPWAAELQRLGADVHSANWPGYAGMMDDPQRAKVPNAIIAGVVGCLKHWQPAACVPAGAPRTPGPASWPITQRSADGGERRLRESALHIEGAASPLFGVLTCADTDENGSPPTVQCAVLMINSGSVHHIGPNRLWVRLARLWAARGIAVLRLDISGIGDSVSRPGSDENVVYSPHAVEDIASALTYLRTRVGAKECRAMGLCSGAYHALKAAVAEQEMATALMINPLTYFWKQGTKLDDITDYEVVGLSGKYRKLILTRDPWRRLILGKLDLGIIFLVAQRRLFSIAQSYFLEFARKFGIPLKNDLALELSAVVKRGINLKFVFATNAPGFELLKRQGGQAVDRLLDRNKITIDFIPGADHTFTRLDARERLVALLDTLMLPERPRA